MTGGIGLQASGLASERFIAVFLFQTRGVPASCWVIVRPELCKGTVFFCCSSKFVKKTTLEVVHTHYFILGMIVLLLLLLLEKNFSFTSAKTDRILVVYHAGLNLTAVMLMVRGVTQVLGTALSSGMDAAISGMGGIGHILLGVSLVLLLLQIRRSISNANA